MEFFNNKNLKGFTLVEVLVGTFLFLIIFLSVFTAYQFGSKVLAQTKHRIIATAIANEEIEKIRNLPYESIGIIGGILPIAEGILESTSSLFLNKAEYIIKRRIEYISDENNENIDCPLNYKKAEIEVFWEGRLSGQIKMVTDIAPKNKLEEISSCEAQPGGILSVRVFDSYGIMIASPLIEVFDSETEEFIASYSPVSGKRDIPLAASDYKLVISKNGYNSERTYNPGEVANRINPDPIVLEGEITEISFSIDKTSVFLISTLFLEDENEDPIPIPNVNFSLRGEKIIGRDAEDNLIYKYSQSHNSGGSGNINISNLEWDNYFFSIDPEAGFNLVEIDPEPELGSQAVGLIPDTTLQVKMYLESENSLFITVKDNETFEPVFSAKNIIYNSAQGYNNTLYTNESGQVFFIPLEGGNYNLEIKAPGYLDYQDQVSVSGHKKITIEMERIE